MIELMITITIIGVLAALAIYGVGRYLASSKSAEAKTGVGAISRGAQAAFEREMAAAQGVTEGSTSSASSHRLCGTAVLVPLVVPKAKKYQPSTKDGEDYSTGDSQSGWKCLKFYQSEPTYYQYGYAMDGSPMAPDNPAKCATACYEAGARGDLNANGIESQFARTGHINAATGRLKASTQIYVEREFE